jgi:hypothetical protein
VEYDKKLEPLLKLMGRKTFQGLLEDAIQVTRTDTEFFYGKKPKVKGLKRR